MSDQNKLTWTWMAGQEGIERRGRLSDANGNVDLSQYDSVKVRVSKKANTALLLDAAVTPDADQTTDNGAAGTDDKGWFTFTTTAEAAAIPAQDTHYLLSFVGINGTVETHYPLNINVQRTFGRLIVHDALGV